MASRNVLKLCKKIEKDCGVVCKPETFQIERQNQSFYKWLMEVDIDKSTGFSSRALDFLGYTTCASQDYVKDLLIRNKLIKKVDLDCSEVEIIGNGTKHVAIKLSKGVYSYRGYIISNCGYHAPDRCIWWEAVNEDTGCADYHAHTKKEIINMIDTKIEKER